MEFHKTGTKCNLERRARRKAKKEQEPLLSTLLYVGISIYMEIVPLKAPKSPERSPIQLMKKMKEENA